MQPECTPPLSSLAMVSIPELTSLELNRHLGGNVLLKQRELHSGVVGENILGLARYRTVKVL